VLICVMGVSRHGRVTGLPADDPAGLLRAVEGAAPKHILLLVPAHGRGDAREQAHVLVAAAPGSRVAVVALPHHALTLALVADDVLRRCDAGATGADVDPTAVLQLVLQGAARSRSLVWHPRLGGLEAHARSVGQLAADLGPARGWFAELGEGTLAVTPGRAGLRLVPGQTVLHAGEAPRLLRSQLGDLRAVPVMVEPAPAPYRSRRGVELTVLGAPALPTPDLPACGSCGAGLLDQQCPWCGHGPVRRPAPVEAYGSTVVRAVDPAPMTPARESLTSVGAAAPAETERETVLVTTRGDAR
jgi:hypothetical protein